MKFILLIIISILFNFTVLADSITPNPDIKPDEVIMIQLEALKENNSPYKDAGIFQTWEFAHPQNRQYTGPLSNFTLMMKSTYFLMLNHIDHNILFVSKDDSTANYFVELIDKTGDKFGFTWSVKKVLNEGKFKDCWMTTGVSQPLPLAKAI